MSASSGIGRIEAAFPKHRLLDTLVDHGETISLRQLPRVIRYLDELRAIINAEKEAAQLERSETPEHEPMVFQMDISPPKARGGQQEAAFEHEGTRSSPNTEPEYELVVQDGSGISEQNQGCLQRVIDEVKRARPVCHSSLAEGSLASR